MSRKIITFALLILILFMTGNIFGRKRDGFHYRIKVRIEPALHRLEAETWIQQPPSSRFYLQKGFTLRQATVEGRAVKFHTDSSAARSMFAQLGTPTVVEAENPRQLYLKYDGEIKEAIWECNMMGPDLVELALYSAWFPLFEGWKEFSFEMEANTPASYQATTNSQLQKQWKELGRTVTSWTSYAPGIDMVLFASPRLHEQKGGSKDFQAEVYYDRLSPDVMKTMLERLLKAKERLSSLYGPPQVKGMLRLVYSPRNGQGYSRIPLIIVSEERTKQSLSEQLGEARDFRHNCHELAHFWWILADPNTPDDWINEGLAEFSAFRISEEIFGKGFAEMRLGDYRQNASESKTSEAIAETEQSSPDREVNRYDKTALMFLEAQRRFGAEPLDKVLRALYLRFAGNHQATTALFLDEVERQMGKEAQTFFHETLYRKDSKK